MNNTKKQKQYLMDVFKSDAYVPMKKKELEILLDVPNAKKEEFKEILDELVKEGRVELTKRGKYQLSQGRIKHDRLMDSYSDYKKNSDSNKSKDNKDFVGKFISHKDGFGFVEVEGLEEDFFIGRDNTLNAMDGDEVACVLCPRGTGRRKEARVVRIITRGITEVVGTYEKSNGFGFVVCDSHKLDKDIFIPAGHDMGAVDGHKVVVLIDDYGTEKKKPEGTIVEILGHKNDPGVDILSIIRAFGIPVEFPDKVTKQASTVSKPVSEADMAGREDLRDWTIVTIDGEDTKDIDDGVSLTMDGDNYVLGVHIADVTNYVQENSALDHEALKRGTSVYLIDRVIPMLPHALCNGICSLNEDVDRLALSCIMTFNPKGQLIDHDICESVIHSKHQMNYSSVARIIVDRDEEEREKYSDVAEMLDKMYELSKLLRKNREKRGSIDFDFPETVLDIDEKGDITSIHPFERNDAHKLIEDFMLAANETVAEHFCLMESPFLYRVHATPDKEKIDSLKTFLGACGFTLKGKSDELHPKEIQSLLEKVKNSGREAVITKMTLRSMQQARYEVECRGHFGLAARYYCHFTSPIIRYPDLQIHRIIKDHLRGRMNERKYSHYDSLLPNVANESSKLERRAQECEREVNKLKIVQLMSHCIGESYEATISGVTNWGIYVELDNTVEGLVHISTLLDDHYVFLEDKMMLIGDHTKRSFELGQQVSVVLEATDEFARTIDFRLKEFSRYE